MRIIFIAIYTFLFYQIKYPGKQMSQLQNKLHSFRTKIRKDQLSSIMKKIRYQILHQQTKEDLNKIIDTPIDQYSPEHLTLLLEYVSQDQTNALLHLGNLIIDRFLQSEFLEGIQWNIGTNQYWAWLINTMAEVGYCTSDMMHYLIARVINRRSNHNLENSLEALIKCLKINSEFTLQCIENRQEFFLAVSNHIHDSNQKIFILSLSLIVTATSMSEELPRKIMVTLGESRLTRCLLQGLMKLTNQARSFTIQAANNFILSDVVLPQIAIKLINNAFLQKEAVKLELSYYFVALVKQVSQDFLLDLIKEHDLMAVLKEYSSLNGGKYSKEIRSNAETALKIVSQRLDTENQNSTIREMCRWGMQELMREESDLLTMCLQEEG